MNTQVEGLLALFPDVKKGEGCNGADYGSDHVITGEWKVSPESMDERLKMRCDAENAGDGVLYYTNADGSRGAYTDITYTNEDFFAIDFMDKHKNEKFSECCLYIKELAKVNNWFEMLASFKVNEKGQIIYDKFGTAEDAADFFRNQYCEKRNRFYDGWNKDFIYDDTVREWFKRGGIYVEDLERATSKLNHENSLNAIAKYIGQELYGDLRLRDKCLKELQDRIEKIRKSKPTLEKMKCDYISTFINEIKQKKESEDYIFNLTETEENGRLALKGEFFNDGYVVVSDGHILYATKNRYDSKKEGKIFDKSGKEIDAKYPNWKSVFPSTLKKIEIDAQKLLDFTNRHIKVVKYRGFKIIDYIKIEGAGSYNPDLLKKLLTVSLFEKEVEFYVSELLVLCFKASNGSHGLLMPAKDGGGLAIGSYRIDYDYGHFIKNAYFVPDEKKTYSKNNIKDESKADNVKPTPRIHKGQYEDTPYKLRESKNYKEGEDWLFRGGYPTGTMYADRRWEEGFNGDWDYLNICLKFNDGRVDVYNDSLPEYKELIKKLKSEANEESNGKLYTEVSALLEKGIKLNKAKIDAMAKNYGIADQNDIMQQSELGIVMAARKIAQSGESLRVRYEKIRDIYENQPSISPKDGTSRFLQQFSTPAPLAFLASEFVKSAKGTDAHQDKFLEPSAGNGMLTISLPVEKTFVNDLDVVRYKNLLTQGFAKVGNGDATKQIPNPNFKGVITNPPFANLKKEDFLKRSGKKAGKEITYTFEKLDHKLAILALENMAKNGRCAIIIGGKLGSKMYDFKNAYWKNDRLFGEFNTFVSYIYRQYNLIDILYISGDLYAKQGTTFPIVMLLIDGKKEWDDDPTALWHTYNPEIDKPINSYSEYWERMSVHIEKQEKPSIEDIDHKRKLLILAKAKIAIAKAIKTKTDNKI